MKALSIRQPWAWLIMNAGKDIENRTWPTSVRGRVLVHAAKGMTRDEWASAIAFARNAGATARLTCAVGFEQVERGGFVGTVEIVDCVSSSSSPWFCGPFGFVLRNPQPLPFTPYRGALQFFEAPDNLPSSAASTRQASLL